MFTLAELGWIQHDLQNETISLCSIVRYACIGDNKPDSAACKKMFISLCNHREFISPDYLLGRIKGADSHVAELYSVMAEQYLEEGRINTALSLYSRARVIYRSKYGAYSPLTIKTERKIAETMQLATF